MMRVVKNHPIHYVKTFGDEGVVQAVVSTWDVVDLQGDRVMRGAFHSSLQKWAESGKRIPVIFSHDWLNPMHHVGYVTDAKETDEGLEVRYKIDMDTEHGRQIFRLIKERRLTEHSFAYDIVRERTAEDGANELLELDVLEVGPTLKGANPETRVVGVKDGMTSTTTGSNATVTWNTDKAAHQGGTVIMDETALDSRCDGAAGLWHIEERGLGFSVIDDKTGESLGDYANHGRAVARLVELIANKPKRRTDPLIVELMDKLYEPLESVRPRAGAKAVDDLVADVRREMRQVEEKLAQVRASSLDAELNERAAHTGPVPEFDERFAVKSVPTEYESGDTEPEQVVGYQSETFRIAVLPGTMSPDNE